MTTKRDYYEILGVSRDASDEDLKKAYRQRALKYHPDRNKSPDAVQRFKEVNEAYQILSDAQRRQAYNQFGHVGVKNGFEGQGFSGFEGFGGFGDIFDAFFGGFSGARARPRPGRDLEYETTVTFEEAAFGTEKHFTIDRVEVCTRCDGSQAEPGTEVGRCATCGGRGEVKRVQSNIFGQFTQVTKCSTCSGSGRSIKSPCGECRGRGRIRQQRSVAVTIPPGVDEGNRVRIRGEGEPGEPGAPNGDLYVYVNVRPHEFFKRSGNDVLLDLEINVAQAALGVTIEIPTLNGRRDLKIPAGTQSGRIFRVRGEGLPDVSTRRRGDELITVIVATPKKLTRRERELFQELGEELEQSNGAHADGRSGKGWFGRIKDDITGDRG